MSSTRRSFSILLLSGNFIALAQFLTSLIMARLLTPYDYGVFSVTAVLVGILQIFREMGANSFLIQSKLLNDQQIRAALGVTCLMSWSIAGLLMMSRTWISDYYHESGVAEVVGILSLNFLVVPFGSNTLALLRREMRFTLVARIDIAANIVGLSTSLALAAQGFGYVSLAWGASAIVITSSLMSIPCRAAGLPRWPSFRGVGEIFRFGLPLVGTGLASTAYMGLFELIISRTLGMQSAAMFSRAIGVPRLLSNLILPSVGNLAFPFFSRQHRERNDPKPYYLNGVSYLTGIMWPLFAMAGYLGEPLVITLYGKQWLDAIPMIGWLCAANAIGVSFALFPAYINAIGEQRINFRISCWSLLLRAGFILYLQGFGLTYVAMGVVVENILMAMTYLVFLRRKLRVSVFDYLQAIASSVLLTTLVLASVVGVSYIRMPVSPWDPVPNLVMQAGMAAIAWLGSIFILGHPLRRELLLFMNKAASKARAGN